MVKALGSGYARLCLNWERGGPIGSEISTADKTRLASLWQKSNGDCVGRETVTRQFPRFPLLAFLSPLLCNRFSGLGRGGSPGSSWCKLGRKCLFILKYLSICIRLDFVSQKCLVKRPFLPFPRRASLTVIFLRCDIEKRLRAVYPVSNTKFPNVITSPNVKSEIKPTNPQSWVIIHHSVHSLSLVLKLVTHTL